MGTVLLVSQNSAPGDPVDQASIIPRLINTHGHTVTVHDDGADVPEDVDDYDLVLISDTVGGSANPGGKYAGVAPPMLVGNAFCQDEMQLADQGSTTSDDEIVIVDDTHPLAGGLAAGPVTIASEERNIVELSVLGPDAKVVAETTTGEPVIVYYEPGDEALNSTTVPNRTVLMGLREEIYSDGHANFWALFDAAVVWLLTGGGINQPPTVVASAQVANPILSATEAVEGEVVVLSAAGSTDPDDDPLTFLWEQVSGPTVVIDDPTAAETFFVAPRPTTGNATEDVVVKVTVSDGTEPVEAQPPAITVTHAARYRHDNGVLIPVLSYSGVNV